MFRPKHKHQIPLPSHSFRLNSSVKWAMITPLCIRDYRRFLGIVHGNLQPWYKSETLYFENIWSFGYNYNWHAFRSNQVKSFGGNQFAQVHSLSSHVAYIRMNPSLSNTVQRFMWNERALLGNFSVFNFTTSMRLWRRWKKGGNALAHKPKRRTVCRYGRAFELHDRQHEKKSEHTRNENALFITWTEATKARSIQFQKNVSHGMSCIELEWLNVIRSTLNVSS